MAGTRSPTRNAPAKRRPPLRRASAVSSALIISGITQDSGGSPLGGCAVRLFLTAGDAIVASTTSDANGLYSFAVPADISTYYVVAYKAGAPDVEGTTVNTLVGI